MTPRLRAALATAEALVTTWDSPRLDERLLELAPRLRVIGHCGGEVKGRFARPLLRRLTVTHAPAPMAGVVAELAVAFLLYSARNVDAHRASLRRPSNAAYRRLQKRLAQTGWIALGSLLERKLPGQGGPRYQWSRLVGGKTVTVALSAEQFVWLKTAIANQRKVWDLLNQMNQLTLNYLWKNLPSTVRRKRLSKKTLGTYLTAIQIRPHCSH